MNSSFNQGNPAAHGIDGPKGWSWGTDFLDGSFFDLFLFTETGAGTAPAITSLVDEAKNGELLVTTGSGDDDCQALQTQAEFIKMEAL